MLMGALGEQNRPVILNRPFKSVAELGYSFRDQPWKTLDLFTSDSGDSGLLDLFTVGVSNELVSGEANLQQAPQEVIEAILSGVQTKEDDSPTSGDILSESEVEKIAKVFVDLQSSRSISNRSGVVDWAASLQNVFANNANQRIKTRRESVVRALSDNFNSGCWNLLIDVVAQSGKIAPDGDLNDFIVGAERRVWVHLSIDRFTGEVISNISEVYYE